MIAPNDILISKMKYDKLNFAKVSTLSPGKIKAEYKMNFKWGIESIHKEGKGAHFKIVFEVESNFLKIDIEATLLVEFSKAFSNEEISVLESQKICVLESLDYIIQLVSDLSTRMGFSPFFIDKGTLSKMIQNAAAL